MTEAYNDSFGETTLGQIILYIKSHFRELLRRWYLILVGFIFLGAVGTWYGSTKKGVYIAKPMFSAETGEGSGGMLSTAMNIAGAFGINAGGAGETGLTADYLLSISQSRRAIKSALLQPETIGGNEDLLVNHYVDLYNMYEGEVIPEGFRFTSTHVDQLQGQEDSLLTILYEGIRESHFTATLVGEGLSLVVIETRSSSKDFTIHLAENIIEETEEFFIENKIKQDKKTVDVLQKRADSITQRLHEAEYALASWTDSRNRMVKARGGVREMQLRRNVEILNLMNAEVIANLESAKFSLLQRTPIISVVDEPAFSLYYDELSLVATGAIGAIIGAFLGILFVITRKVIRDAIDAEKERAAVH